MPGLYAGCRATREQARAWSARVEVACDPPLSPAEAATLRRWAVVDRWQQRYALGRQGLSAGAWVSLLYLLLFGLLFAAIPAVNAPRDRPGREVTALLVMYGATAAVMLVLGRPLVRAAVRNIPESFPILIRRRPLVFLTVVGAAATPVFWADTRRAIAGSVPVPFATLAGVVISIGLVIGGAGTLWAAWLTRREARARARRARARRPFAGLAVELGSALVASAGDWRVQQTRERAARHVASAADIVSRPLALLLRPTAPADRAWLARELGLRAGGVRELTRWLALPREDTPSQLRARLRTLLGQVLAGRWDEMERPALRARTRPALATAVLVLATTAVMLGVVLAGIWAYRRVGWPAIPGAVSTVLAFVGVWVYVYIVRVIDPDFETQVKLAKDLSGALAPGTGKKE